MQKTVMRTGIKSDIALVRSLREKKGRIAHGLFVAEGEKLVTELLASDFSVVRLFVAESFGRKAEQLVRSLSAHRNLAIEVVSVAEMERLSHLKTPAQVVALAAIPHYDFPEEPGSELTFVLDGVQDPGNLGTIIRIADWFGIRDIICSPQSADCFNPKVVQATMGSILRVRTHYTNLPPLLKDAAARGSAIYGSFLEGENLHTADLGDNVSGIIVMGSEGRGIGPEAASAITRKLYIPSYPPETTASESLNVAVATAIVCAEFRRRCHEITP